ncbi:MAG: YncE family protein [Caldilineae bacterium]|nr:MAG: YncE family protein [Caldilineae bacterium]
MMQHRVSQTWTARVRWRVHTHARRRPAYVFLFFALLWLGFALPGADGPTVQAQGTLPPGPVLIYLPIVQANTGVDLNQSVTFSVEGLDFPNGLAVHRTQRHLYVTSRETDTLFKLDPSGKILGQAATGDQPWGVSVNESTNRVYVSNFGGQVWVYDAETLARLAAIDVGPGPGMLAVDPIIDTVAVVVTGAGQIAFIRGLQLEQTLDAAAGGPFAIAADIRNQHFVVTHRDAGSMGVYYRTDAGWRNDGAQVAFGDRVTPFGVTVDHRTGRIYALTWHPGDEWFVEVFQKFSQGDVRPGAKIRVGNSGNKDDPDVGGAGITVNVNNQHVFVANTRDGTVSVVDGSIDAVVNTVNVGADPTVVTMNRDTGAVYVGLRQSSQIFRFRDQ